MDRRTFLHLLACGVVGGCVPVVMAAGPPMQSPALDSDHLVMADGAVLPLRSWQPDSGQPTAVILAVHGFNQYSNFFAAPGRWLAEHGVASYAYDQRGFGAAPNPGFWPGTPSLTRDLVTVSQLVRGRHPDAPIYILGESMGGAVIMAAMTNAEKPVADGLILSAPAVWGRGSMPWYQNLALWIAAHTVPYGTGTGGGLGVRASDNDEMLRDLGRDPLVIKETRVDAVFGLVDLMDKAMVAAPRLDEHLIVLYGDHDQLIPKGAMIEMLNSLPAKAAPRQRVAFYKDGWHMLTRDLHADVVLADIVAWIKAPNRPLPSGADTHAKAERT